MITLSIPVTHVLAALTQRPRDPVHHCPRPCFHKPTNHVEVFYIDELSDWLNAPHAIVVYKLAFDESVVLSIEQTSYLTEHNTI